MYPLANIGATTALIEGIGGVLEDPSVLLQTVQANPVATLVVAVVGVAVAVGMTVLPCGRVVKTKPVEPKEEPAPPIKKEVKEAPKKAPALAIVDLWGVYKPVSSLLPKTTDITAKHATYEPGYKSADGKGRVFNFHAAPVDPGSQDWKKQTTWDALKKRNTQEFIAIAQVQEGTSLPASVIWSWTADGKPRGSRDCDDETQTGLRFAAVDGKALQGDGSNGKCTAPVWDKTITRDGKPVTMHVSAVKVLCTNVGGDGFKIQATFPEDVFTSCGGSGKAPVDETGVIRVWKRIDVEYLFMQDASLPVDTVPKYYEPAFVQMDITDGKQIDKADVLDTTEYKKAIVKMTAIATDKAKYPKKIGWFLLVACHSAFTPPVSAGDEDACYAAGHCSIEVWTGSNADEELCQVVGTKFAVGLNRTSATNKKDGELRGVIVDVALPNPPPTKIRLFKNKATENEDENYVDFLVASVHAHPADNRKSVIIIEPEDYCTDFQPNTWAQDRKLLLQYPNDTVVVNYSSSASWLGHGGFSYPNAFSAKFVFSAARNLRGHSVSTKTPSGPVVVGQLFVFTTHNNEKKSQEIAIVHEFGHAIGLYLPHKCGLVAASNLGGYSTSKAYPRLSCCMNYRSTLLYREDHQAKGAQLDPKPKLDRLIQAWDKGTDVPDFCHRHVDAIQRSIFEKNTEIWDW